MLPAAYRREGGAASGAIFVQAADDTSDPIAEVRWVDGLEWPGLRGIVARVDLAAGSGGVVDQLDALVRAGRVVGVRHLLQDLPTTVFPEFTAGLQAAAARGLAFDACIRHKQLPALTALVDATPDLIVVLDHLGKPPVDEGAGDRRDPATAGPDELRQRVDPQVAPALPGTSLRALRHRGPGRLGARRRQPGLTRHRANSRRVGGRSADLAEGERPGIAPDAIARVQGVDRGDVLRPQGHALERRVGAHAFDRDGLGDHDVTLLEVPAQDHLRRRSAQLLGDLRDPRVLQVGALAQR